MLTRQAEQKDVNQLTHLVFASAADLLTRVFGISSQYSALDFLRSSLTSKDGQYGFANHWIIDIDTQPVACISAWHASMPDTFQQATLKSIISFYPAAEALEVIHLGQALQDCIPKPAADEWCIGHVSVDVSQQNKGLGRALMSVMQHQALSAGKSFLSLDVDCENTEAVNFYLHNGFVVKQQSPITQRMQALGLGPHLHMVKSLL
jgi:ribosomal protein S18 acetylase RimI-like enzyme